MLEELFKETASLMTNNFYDMSKWMPKEVLNGKFTWVRCKGILVHALSFAFFCFIAGSVISVNDVTDRAIRQGWSFSTGTPRPQDAVSDLHAVLDWLVRETGDWKWRRPWQLTLGELTSTENGLEQ
ncbi:hypothetical protein VNO78_00341 [Psophocarpus tetragonolobus]|uniref:Uncharacterized protein n=1 Tax=Psophocarpus tetragonolobus TaxID=3891 RepID=A0AAN9T7P8_PSOTE